MNSLSAASEVQSKFPVAYRSWERPSAATHAIDEAPHPYRDRMISATVEKGAVTDAFGDWDGEAPTLQSGRERHAVPSASPLATHTESSNDVELLGASTEVEVTGASPELTEVASDWIRWHCVTIGCRGAECEPPVLNGEGRDRSTVLEIAFDRETQFYTDLNQDPFDVGIFIPTYRMLEVGTLLSLCFELPGGSKITAPGEVHWVRDSRNDCRPGIGVAITFLSDSARSAIEQFCSEHAALYVEV
ncbi:MAG TPA: PilZ domain-containing protein [Polyangiaceae bacterium]